MSGRIRFFRNSFKLILKRDVARCMKQIHWKSFGQASELDEIHEASFKNPQLIFKHSTRCSISSMAMHRLDNQANSKKSETTIHILDLIRYRSISDEISQRYGIRHESPQLLVIYEGKCIHHDSHLDISLERIPRVESALSDSSEESIS